MASHGDLTAEYIYRYIVPPGSPPTAGHEVKLKQEQGGLPGRYKINDFGVKHVVVHVPGATANEITGRLQFPWDLYSSNDLKHVNFYTLSGIACSIGGPTAKKSLLDKVRSFAPELRQLATAQLSPVVPSRAERLEARTRELIAEQAAYDARLAAHRASSSSSSTDISSPSPPIRVPIFSFGFRPGRGVPCNNLLPLDPTRVDTVLQLLSECGGVTLVNIGKSPDRDDYYILVFGLKISIPSTVATETSNKLVRLVLIWDLDKPGSPSELHLLLDDRVLHTWNGEPSCPLHHQFSQLAKEREQFKRYVELFRREQLKTIEARHRALFEGGACVHLHEPDGQVYKLNEIHHTSIVNAAGAGHKAQLHVVFIEDKREWWLVVTNKQHEVYYSEPVRAHFRLRMLIERMVKEIAEVDWPRSPTIPATGVVFRGGVKESIAAEL